MSKQNKFLDSFPDHVYRYIDQTGNGRPPVSSQTIRQDLNNQGYESYFTVNGFKNSTNAQRENCSSINSFFIDIDGRKDEQELEEIKTILEPTYIVETMRGYHIYWVLDETIFKEDYSQEEWENIIRTWEKVEDFLVKKFNADKQVKDITRILRVPGTYYWKKSGDAYKQGKDNAPYTIQGIYKNISANYSIEGIIEKLEIPLVETQESAKTIIHNGEEINLNKIKQNGENETLSFFRRIDELYPIQERPSFQRLWSGEAGTLPEDIESRNQALLVTASLAREAGISKEEAIRHVLSVGWHGIEKERGGDIEIKNTIESAYRGKYLFSRKHKVIEHNITEEETVRYKETLAKVSKEKKDIQKVRFATYEYEIFAKNPHIKKSENGMLYNYKNGVYYMLSRQESVSLVINSLYEDMLVDFRTVKHVNDKLSCLLAIIPLYVESDWGRVVNVKNGLLNLETRELTPHTPEFVSMVQLPIEYDQKATCPTWIQVMSDWMRGEYEEEKTLLLQQYAGYCLLKTQKYAKALFLIGDGGNGKSTFMDTISMVLGDNIVSKISLEDLYKQFGLVGLIGKRLNIVEEIKGGYYESHIFKKLVSGEEVTTTMKYKDQMTFRPESKFIFALNQLPRIDDSSTGSERRMLIVRFDNNFRDKPNVELRERTGLLAKELPGILNWMIDGEYNLFQMGNFINIKEREGMIEEFRQENSSVDGFIADCLTFTEGAVTSTNELYEAYREYCIGDGRKSKARITFVKEMKNYAKRTGKIEFHERQNGKEVSRFEGVVIDNQNVKLVSVDYNNL